MPRDGQGNFQRTNGTFSGANTWEQQSNSADKVINPVRHDTHDEDIAGGITESLPRDGQAGMVGNLPMGGNRITNMAVGVNNGDAATFLQATTVTPSNRTQPRTHAVQATLYQGTIDVTDPDFGAVGDNATDDTPAFQAAIDKAPAGQMTRIIVPGSGKEYVINGNVTYTGKSIVWDYEPAAKLGGGGTVQSDLDKGIEYNSLTAPEPVERWIWGGRTFVPVNQANWSVARYTIGIKHDIAQSPAASAIEYQIRFAGAAGANGEVDAFRVHARTEFGFGEDNPGTVTSTLRNDIAPGVTDAHVEALIAVTETKDATADGKMVTIECVLHNDGSDTGPNDFANAKIKKGISANSDGTVLGHSAYYVGGAITPGWHHGLAIGNGKVSNSVFVHQGRTKLTAAENPMLSFGHDNPLFNIDSRLLDTAFTQRSFRNSASPGGIGHQIFVHTFRGVNAAVAQTDYIQQVVDITDPTATTESGRMRWIVRGGGTLRDMLVISGDKIGVYGVSGISRPTITGARGSSAALANLLTALEQIGWIIDNST